MLVLIFLKLSHMFVFIVSCWRVLQPFGTRLLESLELDVLKTVFPCSALVTIPAAVHEYVRCLSLELRPHGITVNCVAPGATVTHRFMANKGLDHAREAAVIAASKV